MTRGKGSFLEVGKSFARPSVSLQLVSEGSNRMKAFCLVQRLIRCQDYLSSLDCETTDVEKSFPCGVLYYLSPGEQDPQLRPGDLVRQYSYVTLA